ncbi:oligopeptide/dipeptide ABC transporter ATP-binding protein [Natronorubrum halophilum]|uniref:oligopeptide/dipeptide ABC transporter ATP-binding protein n=1 Tax=Natronorubrum halophilum TaxID=1702106 RepID=UPI000EF6A627
MPQSATRATNTEFEIDDPIVSIRNASVTFDMERGRSKVLNDVSMDIERNEILGVVGESGSGKSMFADALLDAVVDPGVLGGSVAYYPTPGEVVEILELSTKELKQYRWAEISMVFQGAMSSFNPTMKIRTHFQETLDAHGANPAEGMRRARELLTDLYLDPDRVLDAYPHELSGGMRQRTLIVLSMILQPKVLVMDEPTAALDLLMQRSILKLLTEIKEKYDITLIFITHDLPLVAELADRVAVMYAFEFVEVGPTQELLANAAHPYTRSLLNTTPNMSTPVEEMKPIDGSSPDPVDVPTGCSYHPRCPLATTECRTDDPDYHQIRPEHRSKCFHWRDAEAEIPLSIPDLREVSD